MHIFFLSFLELLGADFHLNIWGFPFLPSNLNFKGCQPLFDSIHKRLSRWKTKVLSYAGRVELIRSTLSTLQLSRAMVYMLPSAILGAIDRIICNFFWDKWSCKLKM